jgi:hypothetical protein
LVKNESAAISRFTLPKANISSVSSTIVVEINRESSGIAIFEESTEPEDAAEELEFFSEEELSFAIEELDSSATNALLSPSAETELLASSPQATRKKINTA